MTNFDGNLSPGRWRRRHRRRSVAMRAGGLAVLGVWIVGANGLVAYLMALHQLPLPPGDARPRTAIQQPAGSGWRAMHVLAAGCPCSAAVADALVGRGPTTGLDETVYVAGDNGEAIEQRMVARGFLATRVAPTELLAGLSIRGGPWLVLLAPDGHVAYSGGYAPERPQAGVQIQDLAILRRLRAGEVVTPYPAYGCAIDRGLQQAMDPLHLKY